MAKNLENKDYGECHVPDKQRLDDRQISRAYGRNHNDTVRIKNRIRRQLEWHGLDKNFESGRWTDKQYEELPRKLAEMGLSESLMLTFTMLFDTLSHLREQRRTLLKALTRLRKSDRYRRAVEILSSSPGIGPLTAIRLALELGDVSRFKRKEEFASFTGLILSDFSTGSRIEKDTSQARVIAECESG